MWAHCMTAADYQDLIDRGKLARIELFAQFQPWKMIWNILLLLFSVKDGVDLDSIVTNQIIR